MDILIFKPQRVNQLVQGKTITDGFTRRKIPLLKVSLKTLFLPGFFKIETAPHPDNEIYPPSDWRCHWDGCRYSLSDTRN
jgi:hypothetical protein